MTTKRILDAVTGEVSEIELSQAEIDDLNARKAASVVQLQEEQTKQDAYKAKSVQVEQLRKATAELQFSEAEVAELPVPMQKIYQVMVWLREARELEMMDRGTIPFDIG